jgi:hypothetical protein
MNSAFEFHVFGLQFLGDETALVDRNEVITL